MGTRAQYALMSGGVDWAARIAAFRWINNGWQSVWGSSEYGFPRKIPGAFLIACLTSPIGVPFEVARMAYYGDKTFPKELQRGYTSYFNALWRIPFEEGIKLSFYQILGPYFLFKNSFPIFGRNIMQTFTLFYTFDFVKDKTNLLWREVGIPYYPCKLVNAALSTYFAMVFSYPFYYAREVV